MLRFHSFEKKFKQHPEFAEKYKNTVNDYIEKCHTVKLSQEEAKYHLPVTNYVPQHSVTNFNKADKSWVMSDTARQFEKTLNEKLFKGTDYIRKFIEILRFRQEPFPVHYIK